MVGGCLIGLLILPWQHRSPVHPVGFFKPSIKCYKILVVVNILMANIDGYCMVFMMVNNILVVQNGITQWWMESLDGWWLSHLPLWKIMEWVRQLGWWHSQYDGKNKSHVPVTTNQYMCIQTIPKHQSYINRKAIKKTTPPQISQQLSRFLYRCFNECPIASSPLSVGSTPGSPWSTWDSSWHRCRAARSCPNSISPAPQPPQWCECSPPPACWRRSRRPDLGFRLQNGFKSWETSGGFQVGLLAKSKAPKFWISKSLRKILPK